MISPSIKEKYKVTIGIECHVQLKTKTKLFSAVGNDAREAPANTLVSHIDFGLPGALPVLNEDALVLASRAAFALNSRPQSFSKFDRKHYFYPDLPMGYQITQFEEPIILGGHVNIEVDGEKKTIGITRAHLEADAGKSVHPTGKDYSLVDLNRAGTPLLEIVSEPDMHTSAEAKAYASELYLLMRYAKVSDADLYYGNMRFDVNVSVSQTDELGTRTETKNLNSFRSVEKTVEYEVDRQIELLEKGEKVSQQTRGWNDAKQKTFLQRTKEDADDYRYMPDPDLPPVTLSDDFISDIEKSMPVMPAEWRIKLTQLGLDNASIEVLLEAEVDDENANYIAVIEDVVEDNKLAKAISNWIINVEIPYKREKEIESNLSISAKASLYRGIYKLNQDGKLSSTNTKALIEDLTSDSSVLSSSIDTQGFDATLEKLAEEKGYIQLSDETAIEGIVKTVIADNPKAAEDVKNGEMKAIGFLVGQVMKQSQGKANPGLAQQLIKKQLSI